MGHSEWFRRFCSNIQVQDGGTISYRYKRITRQLNTDFWNTTSETSHSLYVGSYGRNTAIKGFSDLDMVFELPPKLYFQYDSHAGNGQSALLQAVRSSMRRTYSTSDIGADGQVIIVEFDDGITFEVNPVFTNRGAAIHFLIPIMVVYGKRQIPGQRYRQSGRETAPAIIILFHCAE